VQSAERPPRRRRIVAFPRGLEREVVGDRRERVDPRILLVDAAKKGLGDLEGGDLTIPQSPGKANGGLEEKRVTHWASEGQERRGRR
jgi:hypothetical protein